MINLKPKPIDLFNLALLGIDNKKQVCAKGNEKITIACNAEGGQCDSQKYKQ